MSTIFPADPVARRLLLERGIAEIVPQAEFVAALESGRPLRLKMGFDPTSTDIHLGHAVGLRKLRQLQDLGHTVVVIVGDWTAQIGDPSGRSAQRPMLTPEQVEANAQTYLDQFFRIVDRERTEIRRQSEWFGQFGLAEVLRLTARFTVAQMLEREDFAKRYASHTPIAILEFLYPMLQGYDSTQIDADVEFGGTDQKFNCLVGRDLQQMMDQRPQQVVLVPLLLGTDGQKMSKSLGNAIGITEPPDQMFGKLMSLRDDVMGDYYRLLTDLPDIEIDGLLAGMAAGTVNPRDAKVRLAGEIVGQFHGAEAAAAAQSQFERVFSRREDPEEMPDLVVAAPDGPTLDLAALLVEAGLLASRAEVKRLVAGGGLLLDGTRLESAAVAVDTVRDGAVLRVGRRVFRRIRMEA